jgi:hypothetical protein
MSDIKKKSVKKEQKIIKYEFLDDGEMFEDEEKLWEEQNPEVNEQNSEVKKQSISLYNKYKRRSVPTYF